MSIGEHLPINRPRENGERPLEKNFSFDISKLEESFAKPLTRGKRKTLVHRTKKDVCSKICPNHNQGRMHQIRTIGFPVKKNPERKGKSCS